MHIKVVLDCYVVADEDITNPEDYLYEAGWPEPIVDEGVEVQDIQVVSAEVTDSR